MWNSVDRATAGLYASMSYPAQLLATCVSTSTGTRGPFGARAVEHLIHPVDHGLLEPGLDLLGLVLVALDRDLGVDGGHNHRLLTFALGERPAYYRPYRPTAR